MSIGGYGGNFGGGSDQDVVDSIVAEIQAMPDFQEPGMTPELSNQITARLKAQRLGLTPPPQSTAVDVISPEELAQLERASQGDVALPQDAIQAGFGILPEDVDAFQPSLFGGVGDTGLRTMSILQQLGDQFPGLLGQSPSAETAQRFLKAALTGSPAALLPLGEIAKDLWDTGYAPTAQDLALMQTPVVPDIEDIRRQQIGLPEDEAFVPLDVTSLVRDQTPFFSPEFLEPAPNLLNQNPTEALAQFLADRGLLTDFDFEAANRRFAQRPRFGLPIANTTSPTSLLS